MNTKHNMKRTIKLEIMATDHSWNMKLIELYN